MQKQEEPAEKMVVEASQATEELHEVENLLDLFIGSLIGNFLK